MILHTFMDSLREDGNRQINHHGQSVSLKNQKISSVTPVEAIPTYKDMTQRDEKELVEARRAFYDQAITKRFDFLQAGEFAAKKGIPLVIVLFSTLYWSYGLFFFFNPSV